MVLHVANGLAAYACGRCDHRFADKLPAAAASAGATEEHEPATGGKR
jgi:hypothetical protein